jgi:hypothetical protein
MGAPTIGVKSLKITRDGSTFKASWKVPGDLSNKKKRNHADNLIITWLLGIPGKDPKDYDKTHRISDRDDTTNINKYKTKSKTYTLNSFYPRKANGPKLSYVTVKVQPTQGKTKGTKKSIESETYSLKVPNKPTISGWSIDAETGIVSATITAAANSGVHDRYDTEWYFSAVNSATKQELVTTTHGTFTGTSKVLSVDCNGYMSLAYGQHILITARARNRGLAGDGEWTYATDYYLAFPARSTITGVSIPDKTATGKVTVSIKTNATKEQPVTRVKLQKLTNVPYATSAEVAQADESEWVDTGAVDNGNCTALTTLVGGLAPETEGYWSWVRVLSWYAVESTLNRSSAPWRLDALHKAAPMASNAIKIASAEPGEDGTTAVVDVAWQPTGTTDNSTATELSWSDQLDTWRSTDEPQRYQFDWEDGGSIVVDGTTYLHHATVTIKGLEEGRPTYVRARRVREGDVTTYGAYTDPASIIPSVAPASVVLDVDRFVAAGAGVRFQWTFSGSSPQTAWQLVTSDGQVMAEGEDAAGSAEVDAARVAELATNGTVSVAVSVSTGGAWVTSEAKPVTIVQPPTLQLAPVGTVTAQPLALTITTNAAEIRAMVTITSDGISGQTPIGSVPQPQGDTIWSGSFEPAVTSGAATLTLPDGVDLRDEGSYTVTVGVVDLSTGLASETASSTATVAWAHQAPYPDGYVTVTPIDAIDPDGTRTRAARIDMTPPEDSLPTDVYDIYRLTADGAQLIGHSWPLTSSVTDQFAPFGDGMELAYRIACRTADGDEAWTDVPYLLGGDVIRIDWPSGPVELPYNIAIADGYGKDVSVSAYLDGQRDAHFNQGVSRTGKLSTDVIRLDDQRTVALVRDLARYAGTAFVRTPDGSAYEAVVQVTDMSTTGAIVAVTLDAQEVRLADAHMLPPWTSPPGDNEPEQEG